MLGSMKLGRKEAGSLERMKKDVRLTERMVLGKIFITDYSRDKET